MWWHLPPAILKGWFDRVFIYREVYKSKKRFESGRFINKSAMPSVTVIEICNHNKAHGVTIENKKCEFLHDIAPFFLGPPLII
jgi:putative NADPH-quinone reductase